MVRRMTGIRCDVCGDEALAVKPGDDGEGTELLGTMIWTRRPVADQAWCLVHWPCAPRSAERAEDRP